jgi:hypothetical protein
MRMKKPRPRDVINVDELLKEKKKMGSGKEKEVELVSEVGVKGEGGCC